MVDKRIGHYEIIGLIGRGGMGEVYRAHDTVLDRDVALKFLPPELATDGDRMARFQREAKVLASLNHPNIASIFGFENTDECTFLVMELVEGEDLTEPLKKGPMPIDEAVDIARQIAEGLEEAHEKGIIHRDLKPANVKRTPDGKVKVLDFGLARVFSGQTANEAHVSNAPTMTAAMTQTGTVLGTAAYMSPEQARGMEVDRRTDIWAFGILLFEMLTGKQLFAGETASDTLAGILKTEPEWGDLPNDLPLQVERVLRRCLSKDPRQRLRDIGEARVRLENPAAESGVFSGAVDVATLPAAGKRRLLPWALLFVSLGIVAGVAVDRFINSDPKSYMHVAIPSPEDAAFAVSGSYPGLPVISPQGNHIVFSAKSNGDGTIRLYVRALNAGEAVALDGTEDAQYPFWSPDGQWIAFYNRSEGLKKIMVGGGPAQTICAAGNGKGGDWNAAGEIILTPEYNAPLQIVAAVGGDPRQITELDNDEGFDSHRHPQFLPDGRRFLYMARGAGGRDSELRLASLDDSTHQVVMNLETMACYASGYLLFLNQQTLMAQPFDAASGVLSGVPVPVADDVMLITGAAKGAFDASVDGTLVYLRGKANIDASLVWLDKKGNETGQLGDMSHYESVVLSPDNKHAAVTITDGQAGTNDIWIIEIERNFRARFTNHPADEAYPVWTPDGRTLLFVSDRGGHYAVFRKDLGGAKDPELVLELETPILLWDCADDGRTILYSTEGEGTKHDLWSADISGQQEAKLLRRTDSEDGVAKISPDGNWISFWSMESGEGQTYLAPWPEMTPISQVSTTTGTWSFWRQDSRELVIKEEGGRLMSVALELLDGKMHIEAPAVLFDHSAAKLEGQGLDLTADGEQFLAVNSIVSDPPAFCDIVINWTTQIIQY